MTYKIPDSLLPYLEYIPEDMLVSIIDEALKEKIFSKPVETQPVAAPAVDISQLVEQIKDLIGPQATPQIEKALTVTTVKPIMITSESEDVDEDLQAIVAEFAGGMFK